jgi:hypothetical protein
VTVPVDVLAVIAKHAQWKRIDGFHESHDELNDVRAAVAELIQKGAAAASALEESHNAVDRSKGRMLRAALARVQGGAA